MLSEIWRYPVKSCAGESLEAVAVGSKGLAIDRSWAVIDLESGFVASVKRPSRWSSLLSVTACVVGEHVQLTLPNGETCSTEDRETAGAKLSTQLGRSVALKRADEIASPTLERTDPDVEVLLNDGTVAVSEPVTGPLGTSLVPGTVFDFAPIHLISTPTLNALEATGERTAGDPRRFRPNFVVDIDGPAFQENDWPGLHLNLGSHVVLEVMIQSPRCIVPSLAQPGLPKSGSTLRSVATLNRIQVDDLGVMPCAGVYASVKQPGSAAIGSSIDISAVSA